jgi:hypothetical protein
MLETNWALYIAANIRCWNGDHADTGGTPAAVGCDRVRVAGRGQ